MHGKFSILLALALLVAACGKQESTQFTTGDQAQTAAQQAVSEPGSEEPAASNASANAPSSDEGTMADHEERGAETESPATEDAVMDEAMDQGAETAMPPLDTTENSTDGDVSGELSREAALALADKSGCLACHSIERKVVGPAWQDVSKRYQGEAGIKARLIDKVKKGGKGNWTDVTGGLPMPPYSPRVSDEVIDQLVTFVLSLAGD